MYFGIYETVIATTLVVVAVLTTTHGVSAATGVKFYARRAQSSSAVGACAVDRPSAAEVLVSRVRCAADCLSRPGCKSFNHRTGRTCELFDFQPSCYLPSSTCLYFQLKNSAVYIPSGIDATNCSFPFTYGGNLLYSCVQNASSTCDFGCFIRDRKWKQCGGDSLDYVARNETENVTIVGIPGSTLLISVHNWIVIQQHIDGTISFDRKWAEYKAGFGDIYTNFWLGLEKMHRLTLNRVVMLRIEVQAAANGKWFSAEYATFRISSESNDYAVYVTGYSGDAGDGFNPSVSTSVQNGMKFSTPEVDNDSNSGNCIKDILGSGGFWMNSCCYFDLNAPYGSQYFYWHHLADLNLSPTQQLSGSRMMAKYLS